MNLSYTLNAHPRGYELTFVETLGLISGIASPYAARHTELAQTQESHRNGHKWISYVQSIPVLGALAAIIERLVVAIFHRNEELLPPSNPQDPALIGRVKPAQIEKPAPVVEKEVRETVLKDWDEIHNTRKMGATTPSVPVVHTGKHMHVFEHSKFPGWVIKLPSASVAKEMLGYVQEAQQTVEDHQLHYCFIPDTKIIDLEGTAYSEYGIFMMQKVPGIINASQAQESSEKWYEIFDHYPQVKDKWKEYFRQAAEFICLTGYWDVSWRNIILMENGFGFVDFERVDPNLSNRACGISRLIRMAPPEFFDVIVEIGKKYQVQEEKILADFETGDLELAKQKRQAELALNTKVRYWHKEKGISDFGQKINVDFNALNTFEKSIVQKFNEKMEDGSYKQGSLLEERKLFWQPFVSGIKFEDVREFNAALRTLEEKGILCDWKIEENHSNPNLDCYEIYF